MDKIGPHNFRGLPTPGGSPKEKEDAEESHPEPTPTNPGSSKLTQKYFTGNKSLGSAADEETESTQETEGTGGLLGAGNLQGSKEDDAIGEEMMDYILKLLGGGDLSKLPQQLRELITQCKEKIQNGTFNLEALKLALQDYANIPDLTEEKKTCVNHALALLGADPDSARGQIAMDFLIAGKWSEDMNSLIEKYKQALENGTFNKQDFLKDLESYMASKGSTLTINQMRILANAVTIVGGTMPPDIAKEVLDYLSSNGGVLALDILLFIQKYRVEYTEGTLTLEDLKKALQSYIDSHPDLSGAQKNFLNNAMGLMGPEPDIARANIFMDSILQGNDWPEDMKQLMEKYKKAIEEGKFDLKDFIYGLKSYMASHTLTEAQKATLDKAIESFGIDVPVPGSSQPDYEQARKAIELFEELFLKFWKDVPGFDHLLKDLKLQLFMGTFNIQQMRDRLTSWMHAWPAMPQKNFLSDVIDFLGTDGDIDIDDINEGIEEKMAEIKARIAAKKTLDDLNSDFDTFYNGLPSFLKHHMSWYVPEFKKIVEKCKQKLADGASLEEIKKDLKTTLDAYVTDFKKNNPNLPTTEFDFIIKGMIDAVNKAMNALDNL